MKAKKALGQNFLKSQLALRKIIEAGEIKESDTVLEIGPGRGALTEKLLEKSQHVIAVEKDRELYEFLKIKFAKETESRSFVLVHGDILEFKVESYKVKSYKVIAKIPYNITGAILKKFLTGSPPAGGQPEAMILMVQNEVAKRIIGRENNKIKESILSISVKAYGEPRIVMKVPRRYFSPAPKVDSAVIAIKNISRKKLVHLAGQPIFNEERFWEIVKMGFAHKRKKLGSNLKSIMEPEKLQNGLFYDKRAEDLTLLDWIALAKI